jgi:hypothetical protein
LPGCADPVSAVSCGPGFDRPALKRGPAPDRPSSCGSQATERHIGENSLFAKMWPTLMFNVYKPQVGQLYAGMDLKRNF